MRANELTVGGSSGGSILAEGGNGGDGADGFCAPGSACIGLYHGGQGGGEEGDGEERDEKGETANAVITAVDVTRDSQAKEAKAVSTNLTQLPTNKNGSTMTPPLAHTVKANMNGEDQYDRKLHSTNRINLECQDLYMGEMLHDKIILNQYLKYLHLYFHYYFG